MYNLRYHLASLVSIFIALAIGIILGGLIVDNSSAFDTSALIDDLRTEFAEIRSENAALSGEVGMYEEFSDAIAVEAVADRLAGRTTVVLGTSNTVIEAAVSAIELSGGSALPVVVDSTMLTPEGAPTVAGLGDQVLSDGVTSESVARALAAEWADAEAQATPVTDALVADGIIQYEGPLPAGVTGVVNTALASGEAEPFALDISAAVGRLGVPVIGASPVRGAGVVASASWERGVAGTDLLGNPVGTYTIVAVLTGAEPGLYGVGEGATAVFAPMPVRVPQQLDDPAE